MFHRAIDAPGIAVRIDLPVSPMRLYRKLFSLTALIVMLLAIPGAGVSWHAYSAFIELRGVIGLTGELRGLSELTSNLYEEMLAHREGGGSREDVFARNTDHSLGVLGWQPPEEIVQILTTSREPPMHGDKGMAWAERYRRIAAAITSHAAERVASVDDGIGAQRLMEWLLVLSIRAHAAQESLLLTDGEGVTGNEVTQWVRLVIRQDELLNGTLIPELPPQVAPLMPVLSEGLHRAVVSLQQGDPGVRDIAVWQHMAGERIKALRELESWLLSDIEQTLQRGLWRAGVYAGGATALGLAAMLLLAVYARYLSRALIGPLGSLFTAVQMLRKDSQATVQVSRGADEMAELADAFNHLVEVQQAGERTHRLAKGVFDHALEGIVVTDKDGVIQANNAMIVTQLGYDEGALLNNKVGLFKSDEHDQPFYRDMWQAITSRGAWRGEVWNRHRDGTLVLMRLSIAAVRDRQGGVLNYVGIYTDITAQRTVEDALRQAHAYKQKLIAALGEGLYGVDTQGRLLFLNPAGEQMLGWAEGELLGCNAHEAFHNQHCDGMPLAQADCPLLKVLRQGAAYHGEETFTRRDGRSFPVECNSTPIVEDGRITGAIVAFRDISARKQDQERIQYLAYHDSLTGLPNRAFLLQHFELMLAQCRRDGGYVSVLFLDLNRFKLINDNQGHQVGDELLVAVAERVRASLRGSDLLIRQGGDEFIVLSASERGEDAVVAAVALARKLDVLWGMPFVSNAGEEYFLNASIGIACYPQHGEDADALLRNADHAMYKAKKSDKSYLVYSQPVAPHGRNTPAFETAFRHAVEDNAFAIHVQPIVNMRTGRIDGGEVLLRWPRPEGIVSPESFIPLAEKTGLIVPLGEWVLREALRFAAIMERRAPGRWLAVNMSPRQLTQPGLLRMVCNAVSEAGLPPGMLELEITETVTQTLPRRASRSLCWLRQHGISLSIDDFGTGHSSLLRLRELTADRLKIDRSFVKNLPHSEHNTTIVRNTIALAHELGMEVIAEGVETEEQYRFLQTAGCELAQGYYMSRPLPIDDFLTLMDAGGRGEEWKMREDA